MKADWAGNILAVYAAKGGGGKAGRVPQHMKEGKQFNIWMSTFSFDDLSVGDYLRFHGIKQRGRLDEVVEGTQLWGDRSTMSSDAPKTMKPLARSMPSLVQIDLALLSFFSGDSNHKNNAAILWTPPD
jgi:hypothetical protein